MLGVGPATSVSIDVSQWKSIWLSGFVDTTRAKVTISFSDNAQGASLFKAHRVYVLGANQIMKHQIPVLGETVTISWLGAGAGMRGTFAIVGSLNDAHEQPQTEDGVLVSQISNLILGAGGSFTYFLPHYHGRAMLTFFPVAGTMRCYGVVEDEAGGALAYLFLREGIVAGDSRGPLEFATTPQVNRVTVVDSGGAGATFQLSVIAIGGRGADN